MYCLRIPVLLALAHQRGDTTNADIARRTRLHESTVSRLLKGQAQPGSKALIRICRAYDTKADDLMEQTAEVAA